MWGGLMERFHMKQAGTGNREIPALRFPAEMALLAAKPFYARRFGPIGGATLFAVLYCLVFWYLTEDVTGWGQLIHSWRAEYFDDHGNASGSMKLRGESGYRFYRLSLPLGILVYPIASAAVALLLRTAFKRISWRARLLVLLLAAAMAAILIRFVYLGVFECASNV